MIYYFPYYWTNAAILAWITERGLVGVYHIIGVNETQRPEL